MPVFCEERKNSSHAVILKCFHLFWAHIQLPQHNKDITQSWSRIWTTIYFEHPWTTVAKKKINKYSNSLLNITFTVARLCTVSQIFNRPMTSLVLMTFKSHLTNKSCPYQNLLRIIGVYERLRSIKWPSLKQGSGQLRSDKICGTINKRARRMTFPRSKLDKNLTSNYQHFQLYIFI